MSISVRSVLPVAEGDSRPESKLRRQPARHSQHGTQVANRYAAPAAKYIHEQRIRTVRAIELLPSPARAGRCSARTGSPKMTLGVSLAVISCSDPFVVAIC